MKAQLNILVTFIALLYQQYGINAQIYPMASTSTTKSNEFAWNLFRNSKSTNRNAENFILCPVSVQLLVSVLEIASEGSTQEQIRRVTNNISPSQLYYVLNPEGTNSEIKSANGIFVDDNEKINLDVSVKIFHIGGDIYSLPLQKQSSYAKRMINEWASNATEGHIPQLLSQETDVSSLKAILVSAVYFRSTWKYQLKPSQPRIFYTYFNDGRQTDFMEVNGYFKIKNIDLGKGVDGTMINLPYKDNVYSMVLIVPGPKITLNRFLGSLGHNKFTEMIESIGDMLNSKVHLSMPKFKVSSKASLIEPLQKIGLVDIFSATKSKVSKLLFSQQPLQISEIIQQSTLEVDENGTIATSATAAFIVPLSAAEPVTIEFVIDKPFIAVILETATQTPIFIAKIAKPNET